MANPWEIGVEETNPPTRRNPWEIGIDPRHDSATGRVETAPERTERETLENQYQGMGPVRRLRAGVSNMVSGIPVLRNYTGNFISNAEDIDVARRARPGQSALERGVGGVSAYAPASRAASTAGTVVRNLFSRNPRPYLGLAGETTVQGALGAGTALADRPPRDSNEGVLNALLGFGSGAVGPIGSRIFGPSGTGNPVRINPVTRDIDRTPENVRLFNRMSEATHDRIMAIPGIRAQTRAMRRELNRIRGRELGRGTGHTLSGLVPALVGAGVGHYVSPGYTGMLLGAAAGEASRRGVRGFANSELGGRYLGHQITPNMASLLHSLGPTYFNNMEEPNPTNSATGR